MINSIILISLSNRR